MSQTVYTFHSPKTQEETMTIIADVVWSMRGKYKVTAPGCMSAEWRIQPYHSLKYYAVMSSKFTFYIGQDMVRVVHPKRDGMTIFTKPGMRMRVDGIDRVWNAFIESLLARHPGIDFGLIPGSETMLDAIKFIGDGTEQVFTSRTRNSPSLGGAMIGGALFGSTGAIIGSMYGKSYSSGTSKTQFSDKILASARYTNGLMLEFELSRNSPEYHEIVANMSLFAKQ